MLSKAVAHLTYANVMATLAVFIALGGAAYAANTVGSSDIIDESILSVDIKNAQVRTADVANQNLTGLDIADQSGVDTCTISIRIGQLCFRAENRARPPEQALNHCANLDMRLPTLGEALELVKTHDLPNVDEQELFWTDEWELYDDHIWMASDDGTLGVAGADEPNVETVCVTTPTN